MINTSCEGICVEFERKYNTTFKLPQVLKIFYDWPVKYYFLMISVSEH